MDPALPDSLSGPIADEVIGGVIVALLVAAAVWVLSRRTRLAGRVRSARASWRRRREARSQRRIVAKEVHAGRVVPVARRGRSPVEVEMSDGSRRYYFSGDLPAYKSALESGRYPLQRTFLHGPPRMPWE